MRFEFRELPEKSGGYLRPILPVVVDDLKELKVWCLVDSGALQNRFGKWVAQAAGIDLRGGHSEEIAVGNFRTKSTVVPVRLSVEDISWEAPVGFCDPWPPGFQLLGQEGFFRYFAIAIRAAHYWMDLKPEKA